MFLKAFVSLATLLSLFSPVNAFPQYGSLAGLSERELADIVPRLPARSPPAPPGPLRYSGTKLVNDRAHPWRPLRRNDLRGPCPGLNTLASHGYLPRDGVASPSQIINAFQKGFNMEKSIARFVTYAALLVDGNLVTDLISIGGKTRKTGPDPPPPAIVGGLNTHVVFEGDASLTRSDNAIGNNHAFNQTLFDQLVEYSNLYGNGKYTYEVAAELRWKRIQDSIAENPDFDFTAPRYFTAYAEATFPVNFFVDGRTPTPELGLSIPNATLFFRDHRFPDDFHRAGHPMAAEGLLNVFLPHPFSPGKNVNGVNSYTLDPTSADFNDFCLLYTNFISNTVVGLYPNPTGILRRNLIINMGYLWGALSFANVTNCPQRFPYGTL